MAISDSLKNKRTDLQTLVNKARTLYTEMESAGAEKVTQEQRNNLNALIASGTALRSEVENLEKLEQLDQKFSPNNPAKAVESPPEYDASFRTSKSWGTVVSDSPQLKLHDGRSMQPVMVGKVTNFSSKASLYLASPTTGGNLIRPDRLPDIVDLNLQRPLRVFDLVNKSTTSSNAVEYVTITARSINSAVVPEWDSGAGNFGLKPGSDLTFGLQTTPVKTIATWIPASRQILQDVPRLQAMIDTELTYMVMRVLEDQMVNGDGSSPNFLGIMNTSGIQLRTKSGGSPVGRNQLISDNSSDTLRKAITDLQLAFYEPDGILMHPAVAENLELEKAAGSGEYLKAFDPIALRLWRIPVIQSVVLPTGNALVGNYMLGATLWDREQSEIRIAEQHADFFIRNAVVILADLRAAFAVQRPLAFEKVAGL